MQRHSSYISSVLAASAMLVLILDSKTALDAAASGLDLCIHTLIPTLLPFFVLSSILTRQFSGKRSKLLAPLGKLCGIPSGQEGLFLIGILGGYPIGAQNIALAYQRGNIQQHEAERLLGFCNNAGPSFIFGVTATLFTQRWFGWIIWLIHILSAICVGMLLPHKKTTSVTSQPMQPTKTAIIPQSLKALASVCCWVVLIRIVITFLQRWFLWLLPKEMSACVIGVLELTNGCFSLFDVTSESIRFVLCCAMLSIGGLCILAQTISVTPNLDHKQYIHGKLLQTSISTILATFMQPILFSAENFPYLPVIAAAASIILLNVLTQSRRIKKELAFSGKVMYNGVN